VSRLPIAGLLAANAISITGNRLTQIAIPWFVLQSTGSVGKTGLVGFFSLLPFVISSALGGVVVDRLGWRHARRCAGGLAQLVEQPRLHRTRVEDGLEPARGQFLDLRRREIDAVALGDARLDLPDDVIDVGRLGLSRPLALILSLRRWRGSAVAPPVVTATAAMELLAAPGLRMLVCCHVDR
jgi:hypothetical protein